MRKIERNGDARHAVRSEPFVRQPVVRTEHQAACQELGIHLLDPLLDLGPAEREAQIAHAQVEQLLVGKRRPVGRLQWLVIDGRWFRHSVSRS